MKIFDKNINIKQFHCRLNNLPLLESPEYINLYIQFKGCNAKCAFCEWKDSANDFDFAKFETMLTHLVENKIQVNKVSFSGGEPTLNYKRFIKTFELVKEKLPQAFKVVNTNGFNLPQLIADGYSDQFDSIAISRHHTEDKLNDEIFGCSTPDTEFLKSIENKKNLHFSCVLIKDYIDTTKKIKDYLEYAAEVGVTDIGFVNLMKCNNFAKDHYVELSVEQTKGIYKTKDWLSPDSSCSCSNFLYTAKNFKVLSIYNRRPTGMASTENNYMVWEGKSLKNGFSNEIIF
jgi:pyruvate-formate lyase-activating enzyme